MERLEEALELLCDCGIEDENIDKAIELLGSYINDANERKLMEY
jgi:hypothetical protein